MKTFYAHITRTIIFSLVFIGIWNGLAANSKYWKSEVHDEKLISNKEIVDPYNIIQAENFSNHNGIQLSNSGAAVVM
jgi:hypothetical protein